MNGSSTSSTWRAMGETELGQDGLWGLTQVTAHDEILLLKLLTGAELGARRQLPLSTNST